MTASEHAEKIVRQYQMITATSEITISDDTMAQYRSFLNLLSNNHDPEFSSSVLQHPSIKKIKPSIQRLFAHGSSLYERHWAEQILESDAPLEFFEQQYPYFQQYKRATALEINAIKAIAPGEVKNVLMAGSGALPATSIALTNSGFETDNLDINREDLELGKKVSEKLNSAQASNTAKPMTFIHSDICSKSDLAKYDVIWVAALVGDELTKARIMSHLFKYVAAGALLVVRTSYNLRTLLYPSTSERDLEPFAMKLKIQTYADNLHSILIAYKPL